MTKIYATGSRGGSMFTGALCLVVGVLFVLLDVLWSLGLIEVNDKSQATSFGDIVLVVAGIVAGLVACYFAWRHLWRLPYEIRIGNDGTVEVVRVLGRDRVAAHTIRVLEKAVSRFGIEGADARELRIRHTRGTIPVSYFAGAEEFIAEVRAMNPSVAVEDRWPTTPVSF